MPKFAALELNESEAKFVLLSTRKKATPLLEVAFAVDFSDLEKDEEGFAQRGTRLREALKKHKVPPAPCGLVIPKQNSIVRSARLPSSDAVELVGMAQFEAEKFIPFNAERHIISNCVQQVDAVAGSQVLITAVDGPVIEAAISTAKAAGLEIAVAEVSSVAHARTWQSRNPEVPHDACVVLLNIGKSQTEMSILLGGILITSRSQAMGVDKLLKDLQEAMHLPEAIQADQLAKLDVMSPDDFLLDGGSTSSAEGDGGGASPTGVGEKCRAWIQREIRFIRQTFEHAAREHSVPPASVIQLTGEASELKGIAQAISINLNTPVQVLVPGEGVEIPDTARLNGLSVQDMSAVLGTAIRLVEEEEEPALRAGRANLLPPSMIQQQRASERRVLLMISGTMVVITMILLYLAWDTQARHNGELLKRYGKYNQTMKPTIDELARKKEQLDVIMKITSDRTNPLVIMDQISTFPRIGSSKAGGGLVLTEFKYSARDEVTIGGMAVEFDDMQRFAEFLKTLTVDGEPVFATVGLPQPLPIDLSQGRGTVQSFTIQAMLQRFGDQERD